MQWSPTHPLVFAQVDADGYLDIWDISRDESIRKKVNEKKNSPLNTVKWSHDGKRLAVGDADGNVSIVQVDNELVKGLEKDFDYILQMATPDIEDEDE